MTNALSGTGSMLRLALRRDRVRLPVWWGSLIGIVGFSAAAVAGAYPDQAAVDAYARSLSASPSAIAMAGPPIALRTHAGVVVYETLLTMTVGVVMMVVLTVVRHTRAEEELGRTELLRSARVGRHAGAAAALGLAGLAAAVFAAGVVVVEAAAGVPGGSAVLLGASVLALAMVFAAVTLLLAQLLGHARSVLGAALTVLGAAFVVRAVGDVRGDGLVWLSPIGWSQATHPLGEDRWWPLLVSCLATALLVAAAVAVAERRDVGAGVLPSRDGPARAPAWLRGPVGLAFVLQRGALVGWAVGLFVLAALSGSLVREMESLTRDNPTLAEYFVATGGSVTDAFLSTMLLVLALMAAGFTVSSAARLRGEEGAGRLEPLLATGLSRTRWLVGSLVVTVVGSLLVLLSGGAGLGVGYALAVDDPGAVLRFAGLSLLFTPAVLALAALVLLLVGWWPRATSVAWAALGFCFVLGWLGGLLRPPRWVEQLSPFAHVPSVPLETVDLTGPSWVALGAVLAAGVGLLGLRRRDVG